MSAPNLSIPIFLALISVTHPVISSSITTNNEYSITDVKAEHLKYEWTIKNFHLLPQQNGEHLESPVFRTEDKDVEWRLRLYPRGAEEAANDFASVHLHLQSQKLDGTVTNIKINCKISILESDTVLANETFDHTYEGAVSHGWLKFIQRTAILNLSSPDKLFTIRVEIDMPVKTITESFNVTKPLEQEMARDLQKNRLNDHIGSLLSDDRSTDVVIRVGNHKFPAHKLILAARSPVFAAAIKDNEMQGNHTEIRIKKTEPFIMKAVLEFIYTDDITDMGPLVYALLDAAQKYELPRLRIMCESVIYGFLNENNAANILVLIDRHRSYKLKAYIMEFIADHLSGVMKSEGYREMREMFPKVLKELLHSVRRRHSNTELCEF